MALSMLGYRCCSDFDGIPERELEELAAGLAQPIFDAYVNIGSLKATSAHAQAALSARKIHRNRRRRSS
jgi:hypothetical protein